MHGDILRKLDSYAADALLRRGTAGGEQCTACAHNCVPGEGGRGRCGVRFVSGGRLKAPRGYVAALACDPVEKKPFFHVLPGARALSFGMLGCNFSCKYCQNYSLSAPEAASAAARVARTTPEEVVAAARSCGAGLLVSTYNEPLVTAEWACEIFKASDGGHLCAFVSNGHATPEAVEFIKPFVRAFKVDLKCFRESS